MSAIQTQLKISARTPTHQLTTKQQVRRLHDSFAPVDLDSAQSNHIAAATITLDDQDDEEFQRLPVNQEHLLISPFEISAWALVEESSLSSSAVTQFECVLTLEGTNYEQRQSLALQKGEFLCDNS